MGCVSSKLIRQEIRNEDRAISTHVVSLTSSTYGVLKLDKDKQIIECGKKSVSSPPRDEPSDIINTWELMEGLEDQVPPTSVNSKKSPKSRSLFLRGFADIDPRSPLKFLNQLASPRKGNKSVGKENKCSVVNVSIQNSSPKGIFRECTNVNVKKQPSPRLWASIKGSPKCDSLRIDPNSGVVLSRRRSLGPLFDPVLVASFEKEVSAEEEQIKKMVSGDTTDKKILDSYVEKCPPGGEEAVIIYTTTLRGIRKTFEDCNIVRSIVESQGVRMLERDISMHSKFKEELRGVMDSKEIRVPLVFVKGRLIGGAAEVMRLDEEGKLGILLDGIPRAGPGERCVGCAGIRFIMCVECSGSCKVLGEDGMKSVKCGNCNENGLIQCPLCC